MNAAFVKMSWVCLALAPLVMLAVLPAGCSGPAPPAAAGELMCEEHGVPERLCTICHPEINDDPRVLKCAEHDGIPEELCTLCHPELKAKYKTCEHGLPVAFCKQCRKGKQQSGEVPNDWCAQHAVPKRFCTRCDPGLARRTEMCAEHGVPAAICTLCRPELAANFDLCSRHRLPAALCPDPACQRAVPAAGAAGRCAAGPASLRRVRLAGPDVAAKAGLETAPVGQSMIAPTVAAQGEVGYDETRLAHVRPRFPGVICAVPARCGDEVRAGQTLAVVDSAELGQAKADYLAVRPLVALWSQTLARHRKLSDDGITAGKQLLEAQAELQRTEAELRKTTQRLHNFGLENPQLERLADEPESQRNRMPIVAPLDGTVVHRQAVVGEAVEPATTLFTVADLSRVWIHFDVFEKDLPRIRVGQAAVFRVLGQETAEFPGTVASIDSEVHAQTRTIGVRVEAENRGGRLRANMFGRGEIQVAQAHASLVVPRDAVQWEGASFVVFVAKQPGEFEPRRVLTGRSSGPLVELVWADIQRGDPVVTTGSFLLKTEIQKGSIGAGCCGD